MLLRYRFEACTNVSLFNKILIVVVIHVMIGKKEKSPQDYYGAGKLLSFFMRTGPGMCQTLELVLPH